MYLKSNGTPAEVVNVRGNFDKAQALCKKNYLQDWDYVKHAMPDDSTNFLLNTP